MDFFLQWEETTFPKVKMNVDTFLYRDVSTIAKVRVKWMWIPSYIEMYLHLQKSGQNECGHIPVQRGIHMDKNPFWGRNGLVPKRSVYRNVLFDPSKGEALLLVAGWAAKCKQERKVMTPVSFKVSSNQRYWPRLWYLSGFGEEVLMFVMRSKYPHFPSIRHVSTYGHPISTVSHKPYPERKQSYTFPDSQHRPGT